MLAKTPTPPGPSALRQLHSLLYVRRDLLGFLELLARTYGDVSYVRLGNRQVYTLCDPAAIESVIETDAHRFRKSYAMHVAKRVLGEGLLTSEGAFHHRQRRLIQPAFHTDRVEAYGESMTDFASRLSRRWRDGRTVDMAQEMTRLALSIVAKTLFDTNIEDEADEIGEALEQVLALYSRVTMPFGPLLDRLPLPSNARFDRAKSRLDDTIQRIIRERRASGVDRGDLLSILLDAQDQSDGEVMTNLQVRDEAVTLLLAGHESTAVALTWTWYLLSQHPEAEAQLARELYHVLEDRVATLADLPRLTYTRQVLTESMRLFPPVYATGREALDDYALGDYTIPAGATVLLPQFVVHRDPRHYEEPRRFRPERWTPEMQAKLPRYAYFPFGGGTRVCMGESFAWMEATLILATLARHWRAELEPGHPVALRPAVTLRPRYGMRMVLHHKSSGL